MIISKTIANEIQRALFYLFKLPQIDFDFFVFKSVEEALKNKIDMTEYSFFVVNDTDEYLEYWYERGNVEQVASYPSKHDAIKKSLLRSLFYNLHTVFNDISSNETVLLSSKDEVDFKCLNNILNMYGSSLNNNIEFHEIKLAKKISVIFNKPLHHNSWKVHFCSGVYEFTDISAAYLFCFLYQIISIYLGDTIVTPGDVSEL